MVEKGKLLYSEMFKKTNSMRMSIPCRPVSSPMTEFQERFTLREGIPEKNIFFWALL